MNILLVEDNEAIIKGLIYAFEKNNYTLFYKTRIKDAKDFLLENSEIDLAILDVNLPDGNGFDFFKDYVKNKNIPAIFLTVRDDEDDIVKGLNIGAEDYLTKPFSAKELLARVNKILLRYKKQSIIKIQDISYDTEKMELFRGQDKIELSALELKIVNYLFSNVNRVVSRNILLDKVWEWTGNYVDDHTITVYFKRIRTKIGTDIIKTVKGIGYRIDEE
ncbi:MAG: response regulator transcription factor [Lachnospiraceae bacterium]|nr:response regulator transcription factor [Lachnospiraceae bacterium]